MTHAIGIDFGGTSIKSGLVAEGRIVEYGAIIDTQNYPDPNGILEALLQVIARLRTSDPDAAAIGIGLPGLVDSVHGIVHELTNVPGWHDLALRDILQGHTGLPVAIENDANAMAYGEWKFGAARNARHVVCVTLGTGVGGALILNGEL
jgi:glucokinase